MKTLLKILILMHDIVKDGTITWDEILELIQAIKDAKNS